MSRLETKEGTLMRIAVPTARGRLATHFGHCEAFALVDVDPDTCEIRKMEQVTPPQHEPGLLPRWLASQRVDAILAGGMGRRAQELFEARDIRVHTGAPPMEPRELVTDFLNGRVTFGGNLCDH